MIQALVGAGMGVALLPELLLTGRAPDIRVLDVKPRAPVRRIWAVTHASDLRSPATNAMAEILHAQAKRLGARAKAAA